MRIFISTPANCGKQKLDQIIEFVRDLGYSPVCPAQDVEEYSNRELINRMKLLFGCKAIFIFSSWYNSKMTRIEKSVAIERNMQIVKFTGSCDKRLVEIVKQSIFESADMQFEEYTSVSRERKYFFIRMIFANMLKRKFNINEPTIAKLLQRERSTTIYYIKKFKIEVRFNKEFAGLVSKIEKSIENLSENVL